MPVSKEQHLAESSAQSGRSGTKRMSCGPCARVTTPTESGKLNGRPSLSLGPRTGNYEEWTREQIQPSSVHTHPSGDQGAKQLTSLLLSPSQHLQVFGPPAAIGHEKHSIPSRLRSITTASPRPQTTRPKHINSCIPTTETFSPRPDRGPAAPPRLPPVDPPPEQVSHQAI